MHQYWYPKNLRIVYIEELQAATYFIECVYLVSCVSDNCVKVAEDHTNINYTYDDPNQFTHIR